ncbi:MAG: glycosyltransferase [Halioglobus sp.]|nr:glycosyltransferase [Halioglobus sp.]
MIRNRFSVIIPAFNEEAVISRTLNALSVNAQYDQIDVIVVCNGCNDNTASIVRDKFPETKVLELEEASKTGAINKGLSEAADGPVLLLDADVSLDIDAARALIASVDNTDIDAAIGHMRVVIDGASWMVKAFYNIWMLHPYITSGKFAAAIALSSGGRRRIGRLPPVIADDTYLRRIIPTDRVVVLPKVHFYVQAPRNVQSLLRVRARVYRGNRQLAIGPHREHQKESRGLLSIVTRKPGVWIYLPFYIGITAIAKAMSHSRSHVKWQRDCSSRANAIQ